MKSVAVAAAPDRSGDDGDNYDDYIISNTDKLSLQRARTADNSNLQLTRLSVKNNNNSDIGSTNMSAGANEPTAFKKNLSFDKSDDVNDDDNLLRKLSHYSDRSRNRNLLTSSDNRTVLAMRQLPTLAGNVSVWQEDVHNVSSLHSLIRPSSLSSRQPVAGGGFEKQQQNHVMISEKRRLAEQKQRRLTHKLRSVNTESL